MLRFENKGYVIKVNLPEEDKYKGYSVECRYLYDTQKEKYSLSMWLICKTIDHRFKIDSQEIDTQYISGDKSTIRDNIVKIIEQAYDSNFFDYYIERFEYTYKCFDKGNDFYESERLSGSDA